jgi:drug/metabolite transporter (DMT)-like permease
MKKNKFSARFKNLTEIHLAVLLFGAAGLAGKITGLHPLIIVFGRVLFASFSLLIIILFLRIKLRINKKDYFLFALAGILLAFHWFAFFECIRLTTVAIGLLTYSIFPVFVIFMEPIVSRERLQIADVFLALTGFTGVIIIIPEFSFTNQYTMGIIWGVFSGLSFAILSLFNKRYVKKYRSLVITFYEDLWATLVLLPFIFIHPLYLTMQSILGLIVLGIVFTAIAHTFFVEGMKHLKAKTAGLIANLEPFYGIILALVILGEMPGIRVIAGGIVILSVTVYATLKKERQ